MHLNICFLVMLILNIEPVINSKNKWIDPFDLSLGYDGVMPQKECICPVQDNNCPQTESDVPLVYYKRMINLLLGTVIKNRADPSIFDGRLFIHMPADKYNSLKTFSMSRDNTVQLKIIKEIDTVLAEILTKPTGEYLADVLFTWTDYIYLMLFSQTTAILFACMLVVIFAYKMIKAKVTLWLVTKYFLFLGWVVDFAFVWIHLLQEAEINKLADSLKYTTIPVHCDPRSMSILQYVGHYFSSQDECRKYHQIVYQNNLWSIGPTTVLANQIGNILVTPASHLGAAFGGFAANLLEPLPWCTKYIIFPVILLFVLFLVCILLCFFLDIPMGLNLFYLFQLHFGHKMHKSKDRNESDRLSGENLQKLLNAFNTNKDSGDGKHRKDRVFFKASGEKCKRNQLANRRCASLDRLSIMY